MNVFQRFSAFLVLFAKYTFDFWKANLTIARQVLSPRLEIRPESIEIPSRVEKPSEMLALANLITFTPGTLVLDIDPGKTVVVHVLDGAEEARVSIPRDLEEPILKISRGND